MKWVIALFKRFGHRRCLCGLGLAVASYLLGAASIAYACWLYPSLLTSATPLNPQQDHAPDAVRMMGGQSYRFAGLRQPHATPVSEAVLDDSEIVIGVEAAGVARAYCVQGLSHGPASHIINDTLGSVPVTVTYCNINNCARVFTGDGTEPLEISQRGLTRYGMVIEAGGHDYLQDSKRPLEKNAPPFPYHTQDWEWTTWGEWRRAHPTGEVYVGFAHGF